LGGTLSINGETCAIFIPELLSAFAETNGGEPPKFLRAKPFARGPRLPLQVEQWLWANV
jgi:hypothetical protein